MSSEDSHAPEQAPTERPQLMNPNTRNLIVGTAIVVILLTVTAWSGSIRTESAKRDGLRADVAALAASFKYPLLEANSMRTSAGRDRLEPMLIEISSAGGYLAMVLTNEKGEVLATTKGSLERTSVPVGELPNKGPRVGRDAPGLSAAAPIKLGTMTIGYIFVETDR